MKRFSVNSKLNAVLNDIYSQLCAFERAHRGEIRHYVATFRHEPDYNIVAYGNLLCSFADVCDMYQRAGYVGTRFLCNDWAPWETYRRQVGYVVRACFIK